MGWVTFEDGIAYSRNVVAAKVASASATRPTSRPCRLVAASSGSGKTGIDVAGERPATPTSATLRSHGADGSRQRGIRGVAVAHAYSRAAYAALVNGGRSSNRIVSGGIARRDRRTGAVSSPRRSRGRSLRMMDHVVRGVVTTGAGPGARLPRGWQDRPPRSGSQDQGLEAQPLQLLVRRIHQSRSRRTDLVIAVRIEEGRPRLPRLGHLEMPVMSLSCSGGSRPTRSGRPTCWTTGSWPSHSRDGPVSGPWPTLAPVSDVDPSVPTPPDTRRSPSPPTTSCGRRRLSSGQRGRSAAPRSTPAS